MDQLLSWEREVPFYKATAGLKLAPQVKVAIVTKWAPTRVRELLRALPYDFGADYDTRR